MRELIGLYDRIIPETASDELSERIIKMSEEKKKQIKFKPLTVAIAVIAVISALIITAGAANKWDYKKIFREVFGESAENISGNIQSLPILLQDNLEDIDAEISAVTADSGGVLVVVDLTAVGEENFNNRDFWSQFSVSVQIEDFGGGGGGGLNPVDESHARAVVQVNYDQNASEGLKGKKAIVTVRSDPEHKWESEIVLDYIEDEAIYDVNWNVTIDYDDYSDLGETGEVKKATVSTEISRISISPIYLRFKTENFDFGSSLMQQRGISHVILENGDEISFSAQYVNTEIALLSCDFAKPINPEEVVAVVIGDNEIKLK